VFEETILMIFAILIVSALCTLGRPHNHLLPRVLKGREDDNG
jgi:hypothetical protein